MPTKSANTIIQKNSFKTPSAPLFFEDISSIFLSVVRLKLFSLLSEKFIFKESPPSLIDALGVKFLLPFTVILVFAPAFSMTISLIIGELIWLVNLLFVITSSRINLMLSVLFSCEISPLNAESKESFNSIFDPLSIISCFKRVALFAMVATKTAIYKNFFNFTP